MNILILSWRDIKHPLAGGAEQVMHEHAKGWIEAGHKVTHFSSKMKGLPAGEVIDGVKIIRKGYQYWGVQIEAFFHYLLNRKNYDFLVDEFHGIPFFTPLYSKKPKLVVIQETARKVWFLNPLPWPLNWTVGVIGYVGEPLLFLPYRRTIFMTGSESAKLDVSRFGVPIGNIKVVPHGVITYIPNPMPKKETRPTIVYLGVISKDKGIEDALKAFEIIDKKRKLNFWVIGRPETKGYASWIEKKVKNMGLDGGIKFWGFVSSREKFELLAKSHILINPSKREGWGLVNIEANAMGVPVVAYNSLGLIDSVKDQVSGIICKENTPLALAENILYVLNNGKIYSKLVRSSIKWSKQFSWKKSKAKSLSLINSISKRDFC